MSALLKPTECVRRSWICCANRSCTAWKRCAGLPYCVVVRTRGTPFASSIPASTAPRRPFPTSSQLTEANSSANRSVSPGMSNVMISSAILEAGSNVVSRVHAEEDLVAVVDEGRGSVLLGVQPAQHVHALFRGRLQPHQIAVQLEERVTVLVDGFGVRAAHHVSQARR